MKRELMPLISIDNFFESPTLVRDFALRQEYFKGDRGNWPGLRSKFIDEIDPDFFHVFASKLIYYIPGRHSFAILQTSFQIIDGTYGSGWIHTDEDKYNVAGMIYLSLNPTPLDSGTTFYDNRIDVNADDYSKMFMEEVNSDDAEGRRKFEQYREDHRKQWVPNARIQNRFNRCNIFDPRTWHSADYFFGETMENSRLTLVFFGEAV
jgi:hypothetical protein